MKSEPSQLNISAVRLAQRLYDLLKSRDALPADPKWMPRQIAFAKQLLAQQAYPIEEWLGCLDWAWNDRFWSVRLTDLSQMKIIISQFRRANQDRETPRYMRELYQWAQETEAAEKDEE